MKSNGTNNTALDDLKQAIDYLSEEIKKSPGKLNGKGGKGKGPSESSFVLAYNKVKSAPWMGQIRKNSLTGNIDKTEAIKPLDTDEGLWTDDDDIALKLWLHRQDIRVSTTVAREIINALSAKNSYDPIQKHIESLPEWDGEPRIDTWLCKYAGAEENRYTRTVGRRFLIQMIARGMKPGVKADTMLVLEGKQGIKKSTMISVLAGEANLFSDALPSLINDKEAAEHLQGNWIVEVSELDSLNKVGIDGIKRFLSRQIDKFRPAYAARKVERPRRCVFIGTTNRSEYLLDSTGNRRFLPIKVNSINIEALKRDRDQLMAEAYSAFQANEMFWIEEYDLPEIIEEQEARRQADPWEDIFEQLLIGRTEIYNEELYKALDISNERKNPHTGRRITKVMKVIGWERFNDGRGQRGFRKIEIKCNPYAKQDFTVTSKLLNTIVINITNNINSKIAYKDNKKSINKIYPYRENNVSSVSSVERNASDCSWRENIITVEKSSGEANASTYAHRITRDGKHSDEYLSPDDDPYPDYRVKCRDCRHYFINSRRCFKYMRGVVDDIPRNCEGFVKKK